MMPWFAWLFVAGWLFGWLTWFVRQDNEWQSEVLFNLTFGLLAWPLLAVASMIAGRSWK